MGIRIWRNGGYVEVTFHDFTSQQKVTTKLGDADVTKLIMLLTTARDCEKCDVQFTVR